MTAFGLHLQAKKHFIWPHSNWNLAHDESSPFGK